jgi:Zn-dependent protease
VGVGVLALSRGAITEQAFVFLIVLVPSVILHEVSHGAAAYAFGDPTAKEAGRLTLNPIAHVDPFGTVILPAILLLTSGGFIGYAARSAQSRVAGFAGRAGDEHRDRAGRRRVHPSLCIR